MAGTVNRHIILGYVGKDPQIKGDRKRFATFSVATSRNWRDRDSGERKEHTSWHNISVFDERLVDVVERYVKKGSRVYIEGLVETRKWQSQDGSDRYSTETVLRPFHGVLQLMDARGSRDGGDDDDTADETTGSQGSTRSRRDELDDDIPF